MGASRLRLNQRNRTRRDLIEATTELILRGELPSVAEVAEAAGVSRATAYRYFATQSELFESVIHDIEVPRPDYEAIGAGPLDVPMRIEAFVDCVSTHMQTVAPQLRMALLLSLQQWAKARSGSGGRRLQRGRRVDLIDEAISPLRGFLNAEAYDALLVALSIVLGVEALIVLEDLWGLKKDDIGRAMRYAAGNLVRAAIEGVRERSSV